MTTLSLSTAVSQRFNDLYQVRPVWALASNGFSTTNLDPVVALYGASNPYVPLNVEFAGSPKSRTRAFTDANLSSGFYFTGAATQQTTAAWTPTTGCYGITVNSQTDCLNNFRVPDNGNYGFYGATQSGADTAAEMCGIVVGETNWRQCYNLLLSSSGSIYKEAITGGWVTTAIGNRPSINLNTIPGFTTAGAGNWGFGQIAHNRLTGRLLVVQPNGGVNGTSLTFRLHFIDLQNKIGIATTIAQLSSWITAACASPQHYRYQDVTFTSTSCYWGGNTAYDSAGTRFVLCANDEVWAFKSSDSVSVGAAYVNALFSVNLTGGTWLTGTYAATLRGTFTNTSVSGRQTGPIYGARHTNSDDNTVVALYQHNYYYTGGYNLMMVSAANAAATSWNYSLSASNAIGYTIAPAGGPNFVLCQSSASNTTIGPTLGFLDNQVLTGASTTPSWSGYLWPGLSTLTTTNANTYGANMVLKVQPTTEWQ
jgi:hypothetical protein